MYGGRLSDVSCRAGFRDSNKASVLHLNERIQPVSTPSTTLGNGIVVISNVSADTSIAGGRVLAAPLDACPALELFEEHDKGDYSLRVHSERDGKGVGVSQAMATSERPRYERFDPDRTVANGSISCPRLLVF
jgi:hypothetical protein